MLLPLLFAAAIHIRPAAIESHIRFLASDLLEGRETGTRGYDVAAEYVAAQFAAAGLQSEFQPIAFRSAVVDHDASALSVDGAPLAAKSDFIFRPSFTEESVDVGAAVVSAGGCVGRQHSPHAAHREISHRFHSSPAELPPHPRA